MYIENGKHQWLYKISKKCRDISWKMYFHFDLDENHDKNFKYKMLNSIHSFMYETLGLNIEGLYLTINGEFMNFSTGENFTVPQYLKVLLWNPFISFIKYDILRMEEVDDHIGCPSWPNCDEAPLGCKLKMGDDVEWFGHRDAPEWVKNK